MVEWLKYFFLSFFSNKIAKDGIKRSFGNAVLSIVLAFLIICLGLFVGYISTFGYHYSKADEYRSFLYSAFAEGPNNINLSITGGKLYAAFPDGKQYANTVDDPDSVYKKNGYELFIDNRELGTYVEFDISAKSKNDGEADLSYDEYIVLDDAKKKEYTLNITASCNELDVKANFDEYREFLDAVSDENNEAYDKDVAEKYAEIKANSEQDKITTEEYNGVYELYVKTRYSEYDFSKRNVPALDWYYADYSSAHAGEKFLMMFSEGCIMSFKSSTGLYFVILETYESIGSATVSAAGMSESTVKANVDKFVSDMFVAGYANTFFIYFIEAGTVALYYLIAILAFALILFFVARKLKSYLFTTVTDALKLICSFMLFPSLISFFASMICALFMTRTAVFNLSGILFIVLAAVRTLCTVIPEIIRDRKEAANSSEESDDTMGSEYAE